MSRNTQAVAERIARSAHADQTDKAGRPYIEHINQVVARFVRRWPKATDDEVAAEWLHDVIEDTPWDAQMLRLAGISPATLEIVREVTKPPGSTYLAWIQSLAELACYSAVKVKLADNEDNRDPGRVAARSDGDRIVRERYLPAKGFLEGRIARGY